MARRKNIEHLYRKGSSLCLENGRRDYVLIGLPDVKHAHISDKYGDYVVNHVRCVEKCIAEAVRYYGFFSNEDIERIKAMQVGEVFKADDCSMVIRVA